MGMLVQRDHHEALGQLLDAPSPVGVERQEVGLEPGVALDQLELAEVAGLAQVVPGLVARVVLVHTHGRRLRSGGSEGGAGSGRWPIPAVGRAGEARA